tara:strand:- start:2634 stop:3476 length:843 start_codon:yes stop_codon:yes gene_type:complete
MTTIAQINIEEEVARALQEDCGSGDLSAALLDPKKKAVAHVVTREDMVLCGQDWFNAVFSQIDSSMDLHWNFQEGDFVDQGSVICEIKGPCASILTAERTALNFLQLLSGTATLTWHYVKALEGGSTRLLDTRKTIPGLRLAQKYAVRCGGGINHRIGLYDAILIKENHIKAAGSIEQAVVSARSLSPDVMLEVEVETLAEFEQALSLKVDRVMLDNFSESMLDQALSYDKGKTEIELSGNITLDKISFWARTGVDYISVGAMTKHVRAIDLSLRLIELD